MSHENDQWRSLDNAAKAFPSTVKKSDTRVFRFSCLLYEEVQPAALQEAVDKTIADFPAFRCILRQGFFWYYLEQCDLLPVVTKEHKAVCDLIYIPNRKNLLFEVTYFGNRINLEIFHGLSDGSGALAFLQEIVYHYILEVHSAEFDTEPLFADNSSALEKYADGFNIYYSKDKKEKSEGNQSSKGRLQPRTEKIKRAYNFSGPRCNGDGLSVIDSIMPLKKMLELSHEHNTTLTCFVLALYLLAIEKSMTVEQKKLPVVVGIPVNLRNYFPSKTARNFFAVAEIKYNFSKEKNDLETVIKSLSEQLSRQLTVENLESVMQGYAFFEKNFFMRAAPLPLKDFAIRTGRISMDRKSTSSVSNMGAAKLPKEMEKYVRSFHFFVSTITIQLTMCSFADTLQIGFTSAFKSPEVQKNFFRSLTALGVDVTIAANAIPEGRDNRNDVL